MIPLYTYLINIGKKNREVMEGGMAGHMQHPFDVNHFTFNDLENLIRDLFEGRVEDITEKIDGLNIQVSRNGGGEVVFLRNKGDLNSEMGGMTIKDMEKKWEKSPKVLKTFTESGRIIEEVIRKIDVRFFNPDENHRRAFNCECVRDGKTNIIPYRGSRVCFHNVWEYEREEGGEWKVKEVTKKGLERIEGNENVGITPKIILSLTKESNKVCEELIKKLREVYEKEDLKGEDTIEDWKRRRWEKIAPKWVFSVLDNNVSSGGLYLRWINADKKMNLRELKSAYAPYLSELTNMDHNGYKDLRRDLMEPLDTLFLTIGNKVIGMCKGMINSGVEEEVVGELKRDMEEVVKEIENGKDEDKIRKMSAQLRRLQLLGGGVNPTEGIVFTYKGETMKLTGSFAPLNQILGMRNFSVEK